MELLVFSSKGQSTTWYYKCHPSCQLKNFSPAISVSNVLPLCFLECTWSAIETLQGEQGSLQGQQLLPSLQISSQGWKRQHSRNLKSLLLPYPMSNTLLLEAEKPPGLHSSSWIYKRTSVAVQYEPKGLVTRIADSISCSLRAAEKGQCPSPKAGSSWTIRATNNYMPIKYIT